MDYQPTQSALLVVQEAVAEVSNNIVEATNIDNLQTLLTKLVNPAKLGSIISGKRALVREGPLSRQTRRGQTKFYFHLLSDCLIYSEETIAGNFKVHRRIELAQAVVSSRPETEQEKFAFQVNSPQKSFVANCNLRLTRIHGLLILLPVLLH